jgi:alkanesulfonate monooxygenase SsuD/methylene tetrahydromethanopterin reductase-like flavin-dependent oxidoreductase (luciferase family)
VSFLTPRGRIARLGEAVEVIDRLLRERQLTFHGEYYHLDGVPLVPAPVQQPRPPLVVATNSTRALPIVARHADAWVSLGPEGATLEASLTSVRERNRLLDEHCAALGRTPESLERAYLVGWAEGAPFASAAALEDYVGRYREAGVERFIFEYASAAAPYEEAVAAGIFAGRAALDAFAVQAMRSLRGRSGTGEAPAQDVPDS